ncbi:MAG: hypothetical protein ACHQZS_08685 [Candidatus Binatales bacterium]
MVLRHNPRGKEKFSIEAPPGVVEQMVRSGRGTITFPMDLPPPKGRVLSRFLAKAALESMARRLVTDPEGLAYLADETQLDLIRDHARRGTTSEWPTHTRRIYDANARFVIGTRAVQVVHESDFLVTRSSEWYFVLALFGEEHAINIGGPDIDGYLLWLEENNNVSPLYHGKNSAGSMKPCKDGS